MVSEADVTLMRLPSTTSEIMCGSALPSVSNSRKGSTAQIYGSEGGCCRAAPIAVRKSDLLLNYLSSSACTLSFFCFSLSSLGLSFIQGLWCRFLKLTTSLAVSLSTSLKFDHLSSPSMSSLSANTSNLFLKAAWYRAFTFSALRRSTLCTSC